MTQILGAITRSLGSIIGLVPVLTGLGQLHGQTAAEQQDAIVAAAVAVLDTVEGIAGKQFAGDTQVQAAARDVVDAVQRFHAIVTARHAATSAPPAR